MHGQPEKVTSSDNGAVIAVERGKAGLVIINISGQPQAIDIATTLPDGTYSDSVHGTSFEVKSGKITGSVAPYTSSILTR